MSRLNILGLIPARGGSKGVPRKNIRPLAGKSLIARTFETAMASGVFTRIVLSTDDAEIAAHAKEVGVEVPFMRPTAFASDASPMMDVAKHALESLRVATGYVPDAVMLLQPTSPLRKKEHIQKAVELLGENDSVCSVIALPKTLCPHYVMKFSPEGYLQYFLPDGARYTRRQDVPQAYTREGTIFFTRTSVILQKNSFYGDTCIPLLLDPAESLSIDTLEDWAKAERALTTPH